MKISVILPIYNVENYLHQSLDSIGLFGRDDVEIILVNDGSTDACLQICKSYANKYSNVVVVDKPNGGLSDARNAGMQVAKGEYIYFFDSDDWLVEGAILKLYNFAVNSNCEVVQGGFYYAYDTYLLYDNRYVDDTQEPFILTREQAMRELIKNQYVKNFAWGKLYKASIVKAHPNPVGKFYEDSYWQHLIINEVERYGVMPEPLYYYRQRSDAISGQFSARTLHLLEGNWQRLKFIEQYYPEMFGLMRSHYFNLFKNLYCSAMRHGDSATMHAYRGKLRTQSTKEAPLWFKVGKFCPPVLRAKRFIERVRAHFNSVPLKRINLT